MYTKKTAPRLITDKRAEGIATIAVCILYLYAMISGAPNVFISQEIGFMLMRILYVLAFACCAVLVLVSTNLRKDKSRLLWLLLLVPLIYSCVWSDVNISGSYTNILILLPCTIWFLVLARPKFSSLHKAIMIWSVLCLLIALVAWAFPQVYIQLVASRYSDYPLIYYSMSQRALAGNVVSIYSNPMGLCSAIIPAMGCSFLAGYFGAGKKKMLLLYGAMILVCILLTGKRGALVFSVLALLFMFFICTKTNAKGFKWFLAIFIAAFMLSIFIALSDSVQSSDWYVRYSGTIEDIQAGRDVTSSRSMLWDYALEQFQENKLFGAGWDQLVKTVPYIDDSGNKLATHNVYIQLLAETGIIGLVMFLIPMLITLVKTWKFIAANQISRSTYSEDKMAMAFSFYYQLYFLLYCITGNPLYDSMSCIPYFIACFLAYSVLSKANKQRRRRL